MFFEYLSEHLKRNKMKAIYYKEHKQLIIENGLRGFGDVPMMQNFEEHPPVKRFLNSACLRDRNLTVTIQ